MLNDDNVNTIRQATGRWYKAKTQYDKNNIGSK
jgi:hypothetical protein